MDNNMDNIQTKAKLECLIRDLSDYFRAGDALARFRIAQKIISPKIGQIGYLEDAVRFIMGGKTVDYFSSLSRDEYCIAVDSLAGYLKLQVTSEELATEATQILITLVWEDCKNEVRRSPEVGYVQSRLMRLVREENPAVLSALEKLDPVLYNCCRELAGPTRREQEEMFYTLHRHCFR